MVTSVQVCGTGDFFVGKGVRSINALTRYHIKNAKEEILILAYSIGSGGIEILQLLQLMLDKGRSVRLVVNSFHEQDRIIRCFLTKLLKEYPHFELRNFNRPDEQLHAKAIIFDQKVAIVGSANISRRALVTSHEIAVVLIGDAVLPVLRAANNVFLHATKVYP